MVKEETHDVMSLNVREDVEVKLFHLNLLKNVKSFEKKKKSAETAQPYE